MSGLNFLLFHFPFFTFVFRNVDYKSINGFAIILCLMILVIVVNAFVFYILFFISKYLGKFFLILTFFINAISVYFINAYSVIIDETMIGNVLNTNYEEGSSFLSWKLLLYILVLGILPAVYIVKVNVIKNSLKTFFITILATLVFIILVVFANASNWLWIDKNSKTLGGLAMPWSYSVNIPLFYIHKAQKNKKEILLPNSTIGDHQKAVVVLVIGESARSENFSLYGYHKNTNPLLSQAANVFHFNARSSATYTTAGVKAILEYKPTDKLYEILPNYLYRNKIDVAWRTTNWGEPPVHISDYQNKDALMSACKGDSCNFDEVLLYKLKDRILKSTSDKILIILHTSTSHGPSYSKKYPPQFAAFQPVCNSVELGKCSTLELMNAYDNTIVYTDYILSKLISDLKGLKSYKTAMIFVSDHGESLGEKNLYMHGLPLSIAPKEQYEIPFIAWASDSSVKHFEPGTILSQHYVFHSVLHFLNIQSPVYNKDLNIFK